MASGRNWPNSCSRSSWFWNSLATWAYTSDSVRGLPPVWIPWAQQAHGHETKPQGPNALLQHLESVSHRCNHSVLESGFTISVQRGRLSRIVAAATVNVAGCSQAQQYTEASAAGTPQRPRSRMPYVSTGLLAPIADNATAFATLFVAPLGPILMRGWDGTPNAPVPDAFRAS